MSIGINQIPDEVLHSLDQRSAVIVASGPGYADPDRSADVLIATSPTSITGIEPKHLQPATSHGLDLGALEEVRKEEGVHSITLAVARLDEALMAEATGHLRKRFLALSELASLERFAGGRTYVVYTVTHYNPRQAPLGPMMVNIGGDCYRTGAQIRDLSAVLNRTKDLAQAMLKKAVMVFPDIPALHGGKKGEWIILDEDGKKIDGLSEEAIISLGSAIIPKGIDFLNAYKERQAIEAGIFERAFPERDFIRPDSGSPDVLSGVYWRGEYRDKYINMCEAWNARGKEMSQFTCLPANLGGTLDPSARPTGFGVAETTMELAKRKFPNRKASELRFLLEAAGGVGRSTIEALCHEHGVPGKNITVFDRSLEACRHVVGHYDVKAIDISHGDFYGWKLARDGGKYDVWINNGEGDSTRPEHVRALLDAEVRVFTGGANNFLQVSTQGESLREISQAGGWAWPDAATSGGGWTLAVKDILTRCQGKKSNTEEIRSGILKIITSRNRNLVSDVLQNLPPETSGELVWQTVGDVIAERCRRTLDLKLTPEEIVEQADTKNWKLSA